jgi:hypothetical protein
MDLPLPRGDITFDVIHHDGWIRVCITGGVATIYVDNIWDDEIVVRAINKAGALGAASGTLFTGDCAHERLATKHQKRADHGTTWLGGKVTRLGDGEFGPQFRIDWESMPTITE